ncbi:DNA cytosine methyltransferase [Mesorhizobium silamurunense]|uniref:DNA cytosine methyltransferase n=1 Tax=Mesorhizobium silamurunense TaxID=499528 RepID=UPI00177BCB32|nr:DNA cytosine methyltransferase [Mesorhizobium silamurunense]
MTTKSLDIAAVDLFCGAAGLSLGLRESGIAIAGGVDLDPACRYPFEANIGAKFLEGDVCDLSAQTVAEMYGTARIRVLAGCAPCQPFSGYTTKRRGIDPRWQLLLEFLRIVQQAKPEIVTLENVPRLVHLPLWSEFVLGLEEVGYSVSWDVLDVSKFGVPQQRRRLVLLASRLGAIHLPSPSEGKAPTVKSAIGKLPEIKAGLRNAIDPLHTSRALTPKNLDRIKASKPAGTWREWPEEMRADCHKAKSGKTYPSVYGRMSWDKPSPTITTQFYGFGNGRFGHPEQDRAITLREGAVLQSFPIDFKFAPSDSKLNFRAIGRLIGNAVPPSLAKAIGTTIVEHARAYAA